jgi:hypothetical protein
MNIKSRLKKLQNQIIGNDSEFCDCEKEPHITVIIPTADGEGETIDGKPYEEPPEFCPACHKPNPETVRITFVIKPPEENQR